jgi:hypothetical protein
MFAELHIGNRGTQRALRVCMLDIDAIESINVEQLATNTDRLLLRGRVTRRRLSTNKIVYRPAFRIELAQPTVVEPVAVRQPELDAPERTMFVRAKKLGRLGTSTASAALLASLFAVALVLASVY